MELQNRAKPKRRLHAPHVILPPIPLRHLLLPDRDPFPINPHHRDSIHVVLIEADLQRRVVALRPLLEPPFLHDACRLLQLDKLARDVAVEDLEAAAWTDFEDARRGPSKGRDTLRVGKGEVELGGFGTKFGIVGQCGNVDGGAFAGGGCGGGGGCGSGLGGLGGLRYGGARGVFGGDNRSIAGSMLEVLAMFLYQGRSELGKMLP